MSTNDEELQRSLLYCHRISGSRTLIIVDPDPGESMIQVPENPESRSLSPCRRSTIHSMERNSRCFAPRKEKKNCN